MPSTLLIAPTALHSCKNWWCWEGRGKMSLKTDNDIYGQALWRKVDAAEDLPHTRILAQSEAKIVRNHVKLIHVVTSHVSLRVLYCVVDTSYGLGRSLGNCRPALPKGRKYQMVKTQTQSHVRRPVVWTNRWQIWVFFSFEFLRGTAGICHTSLWGFSEAL